MEGDDHLVLNLMRENPDMHKDPMHGYWTTGANGVS